MKLRQWIFPALLALFFAAVLLAGLVPWNRVLPEKEEIVLPEKEEIVLPEKEELPPDSDIPDPAGTTIVTYRFNTQDDGVTIRAEEDGGVLVTFPLPTGDCPLYFESMDVVPDSVEFTVRETPDGSVQVAAYITRNAQPSFMNSTTGWEICTPGTFNVEGDVSYCRYRYGEENSWVIYLAGGGMSVDAKSADQPGAFYTTGTAWNGIWDTPFFSRDETNPFRDWSYLLIPCDTADCYIGAGEFTSEQGAVLHHSGYENFGKFLDAFAQGRLDPDRILLAGSSAGGFGAAMLAQTVCERFPEAEVTVLVDCACLSADWHTIAEEVWSAPCWIRMPMQTDDCVTDALVFLKETYGERVKILYLAVEGDRTLASYQNYLDAGVFRYTREAAEHYDRTLRAAVKRLKEEVPDAGIWIVRTGDAVSYIPHMLVPLLESTVTNGLTALEWVREAVLYSAPPLSFDLDGFLGE